MLLGHEDTAFKDLDAVHVYEILVRALAVNFTASWAAIQSRFTSSRPGYTPVRTRNIDPFFAHPVEAGRIYQPDLYRRREDGEPVVSLKDVCDANEILMVAAENQRRAERDAETKARARNARGRRR